MALFDDKPSILLAAATLAAATRKVDPSDLVLQLRNVLHQMAKSGLIDPDLGPEVPK